jgi:O-6-methylguanine DNA methyltransferase
LIPVGYVASYGSIAKAAGGSPRAVGNVMAANPFVPIVPCHRVVSSDFTLGGYGGGLDVKLDFLVREKRGHQSPKEISVGDRKLTVSPVEFVLRKLKKD